MLATDIDVLVSEYGSGFHLTRRHVECKSGKFAVLDRVLWLHGVRVLLGADSSYLVGSRIDLTASAFARSLDVELFSEQHLEAWEKALNIPADVWPCRSDCATFDRAREIWRSQSSGKEDSVWRSLRQALTFVEVESWLSFRYRQLNKLFRLIDQVSEIERIGGLSDDQNLCARYVYSALLVRLSQYFLAICADVANIAPLDLEKYLGNRLVFGDQDPNHAAELTMATLAWVREGLRVQGISMPSGIDPTRLQSAPTYTTEVVTLVRRLAEESHQARYLPLAVERMQFGARRDDQLKRFRAAASAGERLAATLKAFVGRSFKVRGPLAAPIHGDLADAYSCSSGRDRRRKTSSGASRAQSIAAPSTTRSDGEVERTDGKGPLAQKGDEVGPEIASAKTPPKVRREVEKSVQMGRLPMGSEALEDESGD